MKLTIKLTGLLSLLILISFLPHGARGQATPAAPTDSELLDFDSAGKSGKSGPDSNVVAPAPATGTEAPAVAPAAPGPAVPVAPAKTGTATGAPPSLPDINSVDQSNATNPPANPPTPPAATANSPETPPPPPAALDSTPPAAAQIQAPAPVPAPIQEAPPPAIPAQVNPPPPPEMQPPPPEIVDEGPPAGSTTASPAVPPPPPAPEEAASAPPQTTDSSEVTSEDMRNEARFARIYKKYNQTEMGDDKWEQIAGSKSAENYSLQDGDNLWDISTKFFGNGYYWPKVWQLNDTITNPHMVRVGNSIKFSPGSATVAPSLSVEEHNTINNNTNVQMSFEDMPDPDPEVEEIPTAAEPTGNTILIPPPRKRRPVLAKIPPSFPDWRDSASLYNANGFSMEVFKPIKEHRIPSAVPSVIAGEPWQSNGEIVEMEGETTVASTYQYVIVRLDVPAKAGDFFTIFSNSGKVADPTALLQPTVGYEIDTRAEMRIEEGLAGTADTYRAMIVYTTMPVRLGDLVKQGRLINRVFYDRQGTQSNVSAKIVNGEYNHREVFALHNVVYLNRGAEDGLQVGSLLNVIKNDRLRNPNSIVKFDPKPIGLLKVVALDTHVATAAIISEYDAIVPGDETSVPTDNELSDVEKKEALDRMTAPPGGAGAVKEGDSDSSISPADP